MKVKYLFPSPKATIKPVYLPEVVHGYLDVDDDVVWDTVQNDLAPLVRDWEKIFIK